MSDCTHLDQIQLAELPDSIAGCEECPKTGDRWVHLRMCQTCGTIGCCDSSLNRRASGHAHNAAHPIARSATTGENWSWCYVDVARVPAIATAMSEDPSYRAPEIQDPAIVVLVGAG